MTEQKDTKTAEMIQGEQLKLILEAAWDPGHALFNGMGQQRNSFLGNFRMPRHRQYPVKSRYQGHGSRR